MALNFLKSLDADDIFISYSREDGSAYLTGLDAALSKRGFSCFTDKRGTQAGKLPPETLYSKIRACKTFVLLATPGALKEPENIAPEVTQFANVRGTSRIICVSFDQDKEFGDWAKTPWFTHVEGKAREREHPSTLTTGEPSQRVIEQVVAASDYMKSKDRLRRYRNTAISVLGVLVVAIIAAAIVAGLMMKKAKAATDNATAAQQLADDATAAAKKSLSEALKAQMEAGMAQLGAEIAKADATEQKKLADAAVEQARQAQAAAAEQRARATEQQTIANVRALANSSQTLLQRRPQEIQRSLTRAVEAMQLSDSLKLHILEADTALRNNLGLLARLQHSEKHEPKTVLALSPDGRHVVKAESAGKRGIYAVGSDTPLKEFACTCATVAISSELKYAAAVMSEGIKIFDLTNDKRSHVISSEDATAADRVAISPTGKYLAFTVVEGEDVATESIVKVVETATGHLIKSFTDLQTKVNDISFSATGDLAVGGKYIAPQGGVYAGCVHLWDLAQEDKIDPDLTADSFPRPETFLLEGQINAVGVGKNSFATDSGVWKQIPGATRMSRAAVMPYSASDYLIPEMKHIAFSADGKTLTLVRDMQPEWESGEIPEEWLEVWDTSQREEQAKVFNSKTVLSIGFKPDNRVVVMGGEPTRNEPALVFGVLDGKPLDKIIYGPESADGQVLYHSPDNSYIVSVNDTAAVVWDVWGRKKQSATLGPKLKQVKGAALSKGGDFLVLSGDGPKGREFVVYHSDGNSFNEFKRIKNPYEKVSGFEPADVMSLSADGGKLAIIHQDPPRSYVRVWDVVREKEITPRSLQFEEGKGFATAPNMKLIALSPSGQFLVTTDEQARSWIIDLSAGQKAELQILLDDALVTSLGFSADNRYLGLGGAAGILHIFDLKAGEGVTEVATLQHEGEVTSLVFSDDNKYVATASSDRHPYGLNEEESYPIRIWLLQPRDLLRQATARLESLKRQ